MTERVWEVFRQEDEGDPMIHAGNVTARHLDYVSQQLPEW